MGVTMSRADTAAFLERAAERPNPQHLDEVAADHGMLLQEAKELVQRHGWPRPESLRRSADIIRRGGNLATGLAAVPAPPPKPTVTALPTPGHPPAAGEAELEAEAETPGGYAYLLATARKSDVKRIAALAAKVLGELDLLQRLVDGDRDSAAARAEVARLKQQLADAQARLRPAKTEPSKPRTYVTPTKGTTGVDARTIRAWATEQGLDVPAVGRVPAAVVTAYREAHAS